MAGEALNLDTAAGTREPVYVFGTNLAGEPEGESGSMATHVYGAQTRTASGPSGAAYAVPYRDSARKLLPADVIRNYLDTFFHYAHDHAELRFHVARFACDKGAHGDDVLARLFARAPANCLLPGLWSAHLDAQQAGRLLVFDPGAHLADAAWQRELERYLSLNAPLWNAPAVELVSVGGHSRSVVANDAAARKLGLKHRVIGPNEAAYGRHAVTVAEHKAIWYATHMLCIMDFEQTAQPQQVRMMGAASRNGLPIDQIDTGSGH